MAFIRKFNTLQERLEGMIPEIQDAIIYDATRKSGMKVATYAEFLAMADGDGKRAIGADIMKVVNEKCPGHSFFRSPTAQQQLVRELKDNPDVNKTSQGLHEAILSCLMSQKSSDQKPDRKAIALALDEISDRPIGGSHVDAISKNQTGKKLAQL